MFLIHGVMAELNIAGEYNSSLPIVTLSPEIASGVDLRFTNALGNCTAGNFVFGFDDNGFKICDAPAGGGDITSVTAGIGLTGGGESGDVTLNVNMTYINNTIDARDSDTTYTAGSNLSLGGTIFSLDTIGVRNWLDNVYVQISNLVSLVGNWSDDKPNYYNITYVYNKTEIDNAQYINQTYGNLTYILQSNESNLNVNSSNYWDNLDSPSDILGSQINNDLNWINTSSGGANDGLFLNYTPITTTGNITNGTLKGYLAGNNICDTYYDGSHMCTIDEILNTINQNVSNTNFTATFWASEGAPGYLANANDCDGWTSQSGTYLGSIFVGSTSHLNTYGSGSLVACSASRAISCCI